MTDDLVEQITKDIPLTWITGRVLRLTGGTIVVSYLGGEITNVAVSDQYSPIVGDVVQCLSLAKKGVLALCSTNLTALAPGTNVPPAPTTHTVKAWRILGYDYASKKWDNTPEAGPTRRLVWFVGGGEFDPFKWIEVSKFEVQLTLLTGTVLEFSLISGAQSVGVPAVVPAALYLQAAPPVGVPTWIPLPLDWAVKLLRNEAFGIAVGGGQYSSSFTSDIALLRFTSI